jgi:hypothetical protein
LHVRNMACALLFFAPGNNQLWRVAEWLVQKANSELKVVAVREAVVVLPAAAVVVNPEEVVARVVEEAASQAEVVVDKEEEEEEAASQAEVVVDRAAAAVSLVADKAVADKAVADKAVADKAAAVRAVVVVDARAAADKVAGDKAVEEAVGPVVEAAADPLVVVEWEAEARAVVAAVAVPPVVAAAETAKPTIPAGRRVSAAPRFFIDALRRRDGLVAALDRAAHRHVSAAAPVALTRQRKRYPSNRCPARVGDSSRAERGAQHRALREVDFVDELPQPRAHRRR